jgi:dihydroorotase-like cyclic amidohydrolase
MLLPGLADLHIPSDHAPHTRADKAPGAFGFPDRKRPLPLLLAAERKGRLSRAVIVLSPARPAG